MLNQKINHHRTDIITCFWDTDCFSSALDIKRVDKSAQLININPFIIKSNMMSFPKCSVSDKLYIKLKTSPTQMYLTFLLEVVIHLEIDDLRFSSLFQCNIQMDYVH